MAGRRSPPDGRLKLLAWPVSTGAAALSCALLAACSQIGDYRRPSSHLPEKWLQGEPAQGTLKATAIEWRMFFQDPRLQMLIAGALEHNSDLKMALARVSETRAQFGVASADRLPAVNLSGTRT